MIDVSLHSVKKLLIISLRTTTQRNNVTELNTIEIFIVLVLINQFCKYLLFIDNLILGCFTFKLYRKCLIIAHYINNDFKY